jgi:hypothetical protein
METTKDNNSLKEELIQEINIEAQNSIKETSKKDQNESNLIVLANEMQKLSNRIQGNVGECQKISSLIEKSVESVFNQ